MHKVTLDELEAAVIASEGVFRNACRRLGLSDQYISALRTTSRVDWYERLVEVQAQFPERQCAVQVKKEAGTPYTKQHHNAQSKSHESHATRKAQAAVKRWVDRAKPATWQGYNAPESSMVVLGISVQP